MAAKAGPAVRETGRTTGDSPSLGMVSRPMVAPVARALALLSAFTPEEPWLGNGELSSRTGLPPSTVSRLAQSLVMLGYLHHDAQGRRYRLSAAVLALGYAAIAQSDVQRMARLYMQAFAEQHKVHVMLSTRDRLDLIILEHSAGAGTQIALNLRVGVRMGIASSPLGWALLAALPDLERYYLLSSVERRMPREWPRLRRRSSEGISQTLQLGYCTSLGEWERELGIVAVPLVVPGHAPLALACVGSSSQMTRSRVERELGPRLMGIATAVQDQVDEQ
jgi:DNA-binding IclR family transcriptional regulator